MNNTGIIAINIVDVDGRILTQKTSPWIMYWDGTSVIEDAITGDKDLKNIILSHCMKLSTYNDSRIEWSSYSIDNGIERYDTRCLYVRDTFRIEDDIEYQAMIVDDILQGMSDGNCDVKDIIDNVSVDTIMNYIRIQGRETDNTSITRILISNINNIIKHIYDNSRKD